LTRKNTFYCRYGVFKVRVGQYPREDSPERTVSQNSTAWRRGRRCSRRVQTPDGPRAINSSRGDEAPEGFAAEAARRYCTPAGVEALRHSLERR